MRDRRRRGCRWTQVTTTLRCSGRTSSPRSSAPRRRWRQRARRAAIVATADVGRGGAAQRSVRPCRSCRGGARRLPRHRVGATSTSRWRSCSITHRRTFHLVLASRADPPLPLARLRARGRAARDPRRRPAVHRTTRPPSYFNDAMGLHLDAGDVDALEARTEGWIAALQLAALSMQGRDDVDRFIENFTGDDRFVVDYLVEEVLDRQPEAIRAFLLQTVGARPADRRTVRRRHRGNRRESDAGAARPVEPVPRRARRSTPLVPVSPPVRRRAPRATDSTKSPT